MPRFGVPQLDRLLPSIPDGASLVLLHDPGVEAEPFLYQAAHHHAAEGRDVVYVVLNRSPESVLRGMRDFGFEAGPRIHFVDAFSPLMGGGGGVHIEAKGPGGAELAEAIARAHADHPDAVLLVDPLSALIERGSFDSFRASFPAIHQSLGRFGLSIALFTKWPYDEDVGAALSAFDAVVKLRAVEDRVMVSQYFAVERARWAKTGPSAPVLYRTLKPGGVFAYIPKIVVTGPFHAGKTTFVQTLSDTAVSVNRFGTTVALDHGHVTLDGLTADVFGTPGQERFDPILKIIAGQALGVIVVVDATKPETFQRAKDMMEQTWKRGLPIIIAANKQDVAGALAPSDVKAKLSVPPHVQVVGCVGMDRASTLDVLRRLIDQIMRPEVAA